MRRRLLLAAAAAVGLGLVCWALWNHGAVMDWIGRLRPLPFFSAMAILPALGVPLTPFFLLAGATFGVKIGLLGSLAALAGNLTLCYALARGRLRPRLEAVLRRFGHELPAFGAGGRDAIRFTVMVKLAPVLPAFLKNYIVAGAGVPFAVYLGLSLLITGLYAVALIVLGESLFQHDLGAAALIAGGIALLAAGLWYWRRRRRIPLQGEPI